jgi:hypothetical protein
MGNVSRSVVLGLAIGASVTMAEPAAAKRASHHYATTCSCKQTHWGREAWCRCPRPPAVKEAEAEALLQCLMSQPFATCD